MREAGGFKLGRRRPKGARGTRLSLRNYLARKALPAPPPKCSWADAKDARALGQMYGNDALGDCVVAAGYHFVGVATGEASRRPWLAKPAQIVADYSAIGGFVPGDAATDQGCDEVTALKYWASHGFANGTKLAGWIGIDATEPEEVKLAVWLFENALFGLGLPDAWIDPFPKKSGFEWAGGTPDPENGHAVLGVGYEPHGVAIATWGMLGLMTWDAVALASAPEGGELYAMLSPDVIAKGKTKAPNGVAWAELVADLAALGASRAPAPPAPTSGITLAEAEAAAVEGLRAAWR